MRNFFLGLALFGVVFVGLATHVVAQQTGPSEFLEGEVVRVVSEKVREAAGDNYVFQVLEVEVTKGSKENETIVIENNAVAQASGRKYGEGDKVVIMYSVDFEGEDYFYITDYVRRDALVTLFIIFAVVAIVVGGKWGLASLVGMGVSMLVIFKFILPRIVAGSDPVWTAIGGSMFIIPVTFYLSHGIKRKTHIAAVGTLITLVITGILAAVAVEAAKLTGFASEEAGFLFYQQEGLINIKGLLLAGMIIGTLGILDDITISQASVVEELKGVGKKLKSAEVFTRALRVGRDHIASLVNTLVLVYTGAALPLLLLFQNNSAPFIDVINIEVVAEEIVRMLVGSIGLILAVPITTALAVFGVGKRV